MRIKYMKYLLFLALLTSADCFSQKSEVSIKRSFYAIDSIEFVLVNGDSISMYYNVQLEKYDFNTNQYIIYSEDVFSNPYNKQELTLSLNPLESLKKGFKMQESQWILLKGKRYVPFFKNKKIIEEEIKGVFRLKICFGNCEYNKNHSMYSEDFIIK
jgi:hypothetical protein